jgi:hypothetical protein
VFLVALLGTQVPTVLAQEVEFEPADEQSWFQYSYEQQVADKWAFVADGGYREVRENNVLDDNW